jgi:predicted ATPase
MEETRNAAGAAEDLFSKALDWAGRQGVRSWELRAATSLAGLWRDKERTGEARELLAPVYGSLPRGSRRPISKRQNRWSSICDGCKTDTASIKMRI